MDSNPSLADRWSAAGGGRWRGLQAGLLLIVLVTLAGCAALNEARVDVAGYGAWPAGRAAGIYRFERLPSQQQGPAAQDEIEAAAAAALAQKGFRLVPAGAADGKGDLLVQVGMRGYREVDARWDPFWANPSPWSMHGWWGSGRGVGLGLGWSSSPPRDVQEAVLLLIDGTSHQVLYEGHARTELRGSPDVWRALFRATLQDFPALASGTRQVTVPLREAPASTPQ
ncbi:MAG: hypothetical protein RLY71_1598 [Pseudomonadota bacterium]|jgi:hypothetical protein